MAIFSGGKIRVEKQFVIRFNAYEGGGADRNEKIELWLGGRFWSLACWQDGEASGNGNCCGILCVIQNLSRGNGSLFCGATSCVIAPRIDCADRHTNQHNEQAEGHEDRKPSGRGRDAFFLMFGDWWKLLGVCEVVLGEKSFFIEPEIAGNGTNEAAVENAAGKFVPILVFEGLKETGANASGGCNFLQRHLAQFPLSFQAFPEISLGHAPNLQLKSLTAV